MEQFLAEYGLFAIAIFLFIDDLGVPLPASTVVFSCAMLLRATPEASPIPLLLIAIIMPPFSNTILFFWGRHGARKWLDTHGHKFFLPNNRLKNADDFFHKYGEKTVFFFAMLTTVRPLMSIIAGSAKMNPAKFVVFHLGGVLIWACTIVGSGYLLGEDIWPVIQENWRLVIVFILMYITSKLLLASYKIHLRILKKLS